VRRRTFIGGLTAAALTSCRRAEGAPLSPEAAALLDRAWQGLDPARVIDAHVHLVGLGAGGTGCTVNPRMRQPWRVGRYLRFRAYLGAGGVRDAERADAQYLERLTALASEGRHGRMVLLPLDAARDAEGRIDRDATEFSTPDAYAFAVARQRPDLFLPAISVHPHRPDARERLEEGAARGAVLVKWLPAAQRIDPGSSRCDPFYEKLSALRLPLLVHAGEEQAVVVEDAAAAGHPLRLRRPLDHGVTVIAAHCASLGEYPDLDLPDRRPAPAFRLFQRLLGEARPGRLLGDLSGMVHYNRARWLPDLLRATEHHGRLVHGSDYPLPAVGPVVQLSRLVDARVLEAGLLRPLRELYERNVLWFDLALKRSLRLGTGEALPAAAFMPDWLARR